MTVAETTQRMASHLASTRAAQQDWAATSIRDRLRVIRALRHEVAGRARELAALIPRAEAETLASEVLPFADACRFLERRAARLLAPRTYKADGRPAWLSGVELEVRRDPVGVALIIGPSNYPLFLPGVQVVQALVAGNAVMLKPGRGGHACMALLRDFAVNAGLDPRLLAVLSEDPADAQAAVAAGVDKVFLTGSGETGRAVLTQLAERITPAVAELSGDDSVFVLPGADLDLVAKAVNFGASFNGGATCIAPKRVLAPAGMAAELARRITAQIPVMATLSDDDALVKGQASGYALGATVFGPRRQAEEFARRLNAGIVVINDMIVPTADPRISFGGRGRSGFGLTRGPEGLLEMTALKTIVVRRSRWLPHLEQMRFSDGELFAAFVEASHGGSLALRMRALYRLARLAARRKRIEET